MRQLRQEVGRKALSLLGASALSPSQKVKHARIQECLAQPEVAAVVLDAAKASAQVLRDSGVLPQKSVAALRDEESPQRLRKKSVTGRKKREKSLGGVEGDGDDISGWNQPTLVDRATSPVEFAKKAKAPDPKAVLERQRQHDAKIAEAARQEIIAEFERSDSRQVVSNAVHYLRLALAYLLSSTDEPVPELANDQIVTKPTAEIVERMTALILQLSADRMEQIRRSYNLLRTDLIGERSRCVLFSNTTVSRGVTCELICGKEAILQSPEAIDHAVKHDIRIYSDMRHQKRVANILFGTPPKDCEGERDQEDVSAPPRVAEGGLPPIRGRDMLREASTEIPCVELASTPDLGGISVRRLQGNLQQTNVSHTPEPLAVSHWKSSPVKQSRYRRT